MEDKDPDLVRRRRLMVLIVIVAVLAFIGVASWMYERATSDRPFTFSQLIFLLMLIPVVVLVVAFFVNPSRKSNTSGGDPSQPLVADFPEEKSVVIVPWQGHAAIVHKAPSLPMSKLASEHDDFTPSVLIINAEIVDARDERTILTDFDPPIEIQVKFPDTVIANARKRASQTKSAPSNDDVLAALQLGFWDGSRWVLFTKEKHNFRLLTTGGIVGVVTLKKWGDPPVGAGP